MVRTPIIVASVALVLIIAGCSAPTAPEPDNSTFESLPQSDLNATEITNAHLTGLSAAESYVIQTQQQTVTETTNVSVTQQIESTRRINLRTDQELLIATTTQRQEVQSQSQSQHHHSHNHNLKAVRFKVPIDITMITEQYMSTRHSQIGHNTRFSRDSRQPSTRLLNGHLLSG
ncbi:MAG: hypothetical protein J07HQW1_01164 [Haloquadratum walsbyi J07HQW1]|uniref:Uncharacterized protein n=1 Tax=Haloquadratum walsbyi J07HQW1 TaxID=1238424 RepID=U1PC31_9EURY|nr:MAG: hypothetical protein J07HQW1_01164 [Haloquadratum walsbyi J07HQW1]